MTDIDKILASGSYTDRNGREWSPWHDLTGGPSEWIRWGDHRFEHPLTPDQMRLKIERDLHRAVCPGLRRCQEHPVPHVVYWRLSRSFAVYNLPADREEAAYTHEQALEAARHMTGAA